jgi:hypothetical protein
MNTYFAVFCIPAATIADWTSKVSPEERKTQMDKMMADWQAWQNKNAAAIKDSGKPLGKTKRVMANGVTDVKNDMNYYIIFEAASHEDAAAMMQDNPHITTIPDAYVDVMEIPKMGM